MTNQLDTLESLLQRVRCGSQDAAWELVETYGRHVYRLVRRQMSADLRTLCDSDDFVQAVWKSFFTDSKKLQEINDTGQILAVLAAMARNKVIDEARRRKSQKRFDVTPSRSPNAEPEPPTAMRSREPTPSQVAIAKERWEKLLRGATDRERKILQLRFEGASYAEIAKKLDVSKRTVIRAMGLLRQQTT